ncbi:DeoR/GlpR family DNA-binding transcription regulator [Gluconobacter wancherniae]|uniref:DeoR/GlpR family DNA-binding transcription regulator n=1 Tax=Gluconobacter wancherniae TaxID=1307955 RepID=UPI001B8CBB1F|nr:DeoR/GlpR family DNA-binding transcription regulator [Gluconobacter wancherniae]MBS1062730.1 DeoR/GlpR transcriptional regulator [Gluconobacter wancherniae]MBS1094865.1 DeoR/GlpR transcriptional regulator [Gluconobacter wancherniae]
MVADRLTQIRRYLYLNGMTGVHELAEKIDASLATVRRDLQRLEDEGIIVRTHGGAAIAESKDREIAFETREKLNIENKRAIAQAAFPHLKKGSAVFFDSGTSVLQFARLLRLDPMPLKVFSNNILIAETLSGVSGIDMTLLGGKVRHTQRSIVGWLAEQVIGGLWFDQAYLGAHAVQSDDSIATPDGEEASLNAAIMRRTDECHLLADHTKFDRHSTYRVGGLNQLSHIFTDTKLDPARLRALRERGHKIIVA